MGREAEEVWIGRPVRDRFCRSDRSPNAERLSPAGTPRSTRPFIAQGTRRRRAAYHPRVSRLEVEPREKFLLAPLPLIPSYLDLPMQKVQELRQVPSLVPPGQGIRAIAARVSD